MYAKAVAIKTNFIGWVSLESSQKISQLRVLQHTLNIELASSCYVSVQLNTPIHGVQVSQFRTALIATALFFLCPISMQFKAWLLLLSIESLLAENVVRKWLPVVQKTRGLWSGGEK